MMAAAKPSQTAHHPAPLRHRAPALLVMFILAGAPLAWLGQLIVTYLLASRACFPHVVPETLPTLRWLSSALAALIGAAIVVSFASLVAARWLWRETRTEAEGARHHALSFGEGRTRFVALVGVIVSGLFSLACVFALAAYLLVPPCH